MHKMAYIYIFQIFFLMFYCLIIIIFANLASNSNILLARHYLPSNGFAKLILYNIIPRLWTEDLYVIEICLYLWNLRKSTMLSRVLLLYS